MKDVNEEIKIMKYAIFAIAMLVGATGAFACNSTSIGCALTEPYGVPVSPPVSCTILGNSVYCN